METNVLSGTSAVHPHVRGDNAGHPGMIVKSVGSPPRAWGQRSGRRRGWEGNRFTPTCVGTTRPGPSPGAAFSVHPHVRGDNSRSFSRPRAADGSPPRAWGQLRKAVGGLPGGRFTPTCVGTTVSAPNGATRGPVHPHVRGDNTGWPWSPAPLDGSPPRAWGQRCPGFHANGKRRFTPTCVGTTEIVAPAASQGPVHPHVRGDNGKEKFIDNTQAGSPPRAWGQRTAVVCRPFSARFTPTCVGTTTSQGKTTHCPGGSPPRAWGQRLRRPGLLQVKRFTPTCVGTTRGSLQLDFRHTVHPHVRGDNGMGGKHSCKNDGSPPRAWGQRTRFHLPTCTPRGSPPRAWGQPARAGGPRSRGRFTPTCVGTTSRSRVPL